MKTTESRHKKNLLFLRQKKVFSQESMALALGYTRSSYKEYEYDKQPDIGFLLKLSSYFGISINDFLEKDLEETEKTNQLVSSHTIGNGFRILTVTVNDKQKENIEFVPVKAKAGYLTGYSDPQFIVSLKKFSFPLPSTGTFRAFEIEGDSMPPHQSGTIIIGKYVDGWNELKNLRTYVVVTKEDGVVYKRILNKIREKGHLVLMSDNPVYAPYLKKSDEILEIWEYYCHISFDEREGQQQITDERLLTKIDELTMEVAELSNIVRGKLGAAA